MRNDLTSEILTSCVHTLLFCMALNAIVPDLYQDHVRVFNIIALIGCVLRVAVSTMLKCSVKFIKQEYSIICRANCR